jgi:hypothetical protein
VVVVGGIVVVVVAGAVVVVTGEVVVVVIGAVVLVVLVPGNVVVPGTVVDDPEPGAVAGAGAGGTGLSTPPQGPLSDGDRLGTL